MRYCGLLIAGLSVLSVVGAEAPDMLRSVEKETLAVNADRQCNWFAGNTPPSLQIYGGSAAGSLIPESLQIEAGGRRLAPGTDFLVNADWSKFALTESAGIAPGTPVQLSYQYRLRRIDSVVRHPDGNESTVTGTPELNLALVPEIPPGTIRVANVFHDYNAARTYPVREQVAETASTRGRIPRTLEKLRRGEAVKIVCWGDSVTAGAEATPGNAYPAVLERSLRERFPEAKLTVTVVAVPGSSSTNWLWPREYPFGNSDWERVAAEHPDLIVLEFVNDTGLASVEAVMSHYGEILRRVQALDAELILITPHFTCPAMMNFPDGAYGRECRPYVAGLRQFAEHHQLGLADTAARWEALEAQGVPYVTLLVNAINHPDDRGHRLFVDEVLKNFD